MAFDLGWKDSIRRGWGPRLTEPVAVNIDPVAYSRMEGRVDGQQLQIQMVGDKYYLIVGHVWSGAITIHDVTDPANPQMVATIPTPNKDTWHIKVQVADDILMTACEGAFMAKDVDIDNAVLGVRFFDVSDPTAPKELSLWESEEGGGGVHRSWWNGGRYAYLSAGVPLEGALYHWRRGRTRVMTTLDISDPAASQARLRLLAPGADR